MTLNWKVLLRGAIAAGCASLFLLSAASAATWPMKQRDMHHTGRADYDVPEERLNSSFFDIFLWQKPAPDSPYDGCFSSTSMSFYDGAGPEGADIVVGTYHWPKGVQGMDRHSGAWLWNGSIPGGEAIARITPAFSDDGSTLYAINDYTESGEYPNGHPCMAFSTADGPSTIWHNGDDQAPDHLSMESPILAPDGRIFLHTWDGRPYAGFDEGDAITEVWAAETDIDCIWNEPSLYEDGLDLQVVIGDRWNGVHCYDGNDGTELWTMDVGVMIDAPVTIDPDNGNIYVCGGDESIFVLGLDKDGNALWSEAMLMIFEYIPDQNNRQRAQSCGCLSHDGSTYYFQTNSEEGDGALYAINTSDGSVKWSYATGSTGWEITSSCPIVTSNGVVIVGNNLGDAYFAIHDEGDRGRLLDFFSVTSSAADQGHAVASATLSPEGDLYLPLRTPWIVSNGDGDTPTNEPANLFSAFDLRPEGVAMLPCPPWQAAFALNGAVEVTWQEVDDPEYWFDHYAIYRHTEPFLWIQGMQPIVTVDEIDGLSFVDQTADNGTSYYYAVTTVTAEGWENNVVESVGPRTPFDETDLQVVSISRTPRYPRYLPNYQYHEITEPSGFGPYIIYAAMGLEGGQDENTQRWPEIGDPVTYTATVRNRGTNNWTGTLTGSWTVDGVPAVSTPQGIALDPNETVIYEFVTTWDGASHEIGFAVDPADARSENNAMTIDTKSVAFMSYIDRSRLEVFREETADYPLAATDDFIDWLNHHMARLNELFDDAGTAKRVHYDVLEVIADYEEDPDVDRVYFGVFPFRYFWDEGSLRLSGYYDEDEDLDYGLLHEWGHQLGLIDLYLISMFSEFNHVTGEAHSAPMGLMNSVSHLISEHSAQAMTHWLDKAHGYFGQYLYCLPEHVKLHLTGLTGGPLVGATVTVYQKAERPGMGIVLTDQIKAQGVTDENGEWILPNVPIDPQIVPPTFVGDVLHDNPFGYIHVVGSNGVLLLKIEHEGFVDYTWLDIIEVNLATWAGETGTVTIEREVILDGDIQYVPLDDMAELNASSWKVVSDLGTATVSDDTGLVTAGEGSVCMDTDGCFDNYMRYPADRLARWNLSNRGSIHLHCYALNENWSFQNSSPWIKLYGPDGYIEYHSHNDILNDAVGHWIELEIPFDGDGVWTRTDHGNVSLSEIHSLRIHADTWDCGFSLWVDGVSFDYDPASVDPAEQPLRLALSHNAPNPFMAATELHFALPRAEAVDLAVFDVMGRRVRTLLAGTLEAGRHNATWNGRDDAGHPAGAGVYFARLRVGSSTLERKMILR
ncbi:MAG: PQQ-binding-like beta-propeller repeat protein [Candidatus Eisenbacteria bacterium]|nr:PQQ-binding-like beta-propeller repeat protein [Candidatus Eisenbacteria bacterium]